MGRFKVIKMRWLAASVGAFLSLLTALAALASTDDPFAWLEEIRSPRALEWVRGENTYTLKTLTKDADYNETFAEAAAIIGARDRIPYGTLAGGQIYNFWQDDAHPRGVWRRAKLKRFRDSSPDWTLLLDLDVLSAVQNESWVWKGAECLPPEFTRCLVRLSRSGGDAIVVREFDLPSKSFVVGGFDVPEAKTEIRWVDYNTVLIATNWGQGSLTRAGYPRKVKVWTRGQSLREARTVYEGDGSDVSVTPVVYAAPDRRVERFVVRGFNTFNNEVFYVDQSWRTIKLPIPSFAQFKGVHRGQVLLQLMRDWQTSGRTYPQGSLVAFSLESYVTDGGVALSVQSLFTPDRTSAIASVAASRDAVLVAVLENVKGRLHEVTFDGTRWMWRRVALPDNGSVDIAAASSFDSDVLIKYSSFLIPDRVYRLAKGGEPEIVKELPDRFDTYGLIVKQYEAVSADGTKIPYFLVRKEDTENDGQTPTVLYAYGGFQVSTTPWYWSVAGKLWLEKGGAYAVANVRGGGEFGPRWHEAAVGERRQRNFEDLAAVARDMIARGITSQRRLGVMGASQGGLLAAGAFVENPDLFNAVSAQVPLTDMLRYTRLSAGASWIAEYGDPADPRMRAVISQWSPYQNLRAGVKYPRVFFMTSTKDERVHPGHARKMAAKMHALGQPYLYFETPDAPQDAATTTRQRAEQLALTYTYFREQLME